MERKQANGVRANAFSLRIARTEADLQAVYRFRYDVYVEEMKRAQKSADHGRRTVNDPLDATSVVLGAFQGAAEGSECVGTGRLNFSDNCPFENRELYAFDAFEEAFPGRVAFTTKLMIRRDLRRSALFRELVCGLYQVTLAPACLVIQVAPTYAAPPIGGSGDPAYPTHVQGASAPTTSGSVH